ncbi:MAG: HEAT repeat domain-containing protein [Myxococcota bacterium]
MSLRGGALLLLVLSCSCASPRGEGRLLNRMAPAHPDRWPRPTPLGEGGGVDITEGALTDEEASQLEPACTAAVARVLRARGEVRRARRDEYRVVVTRLVVDTYLTKRSERLVRVRAVAEVRDGDKPLSSATGLSSLLSGAPSFRGGAAEPGEVQKTVEHACELAARELMKPPAPVSVDERARLHAQLTGPDARTRADAVMILAQRLDEPSAPQLVNALGDTDAAVRRVAAWALGELAHAPAAEPLAFLVETDPDYGVRTEAYGAITKLLLLHPEVRAAVRAGRERGRVSREDTTPPEEPAPPEEEGPSRVLELPEDGSGAGDG